MTRDPVHPQPLDPEPLDPELLDPELLDPASDPDGGASRRAFLAGAGAATVAGPAVAGGLVAFAPAAAAATTGSTGTAAAGGSAGRDGAAVVAYVRDAAGGEVRLMSGEREVVVHDRALARTLTRHFDEQER